MSAGKSPSECDERPSGLHLHGSRGEWGGRWRFSRTQDGAGALVREGGPKSFHSKVTWSGDSEGCSHEGGEREQSRDELISSEPHFGMACHRQNHAPTGSLVWRAGESPHNRAR